MRVLGLDVGERRIGVAVSDPTGTIARPVTVVQRRSRANDFAAIGALVAEYGARLVVVGQPLTLDGKIGPQAREVERYAQSLAQALPVPLRMWDERYSTLTAEDAIRESRGRGKRRRESEVDAVAAAVILQAFLDSQEALVGRDVEEKE